MMNILLCIFILVCNSSCNFATYMQETPFFSAPISNVTVEVGKAARLACPVENLGPYKVAWVKTSNDALLTIATTVLTKNPQISIARPSRTTWLLQVSDVTKSDAGKYMCQLNTVPARKLYGYITVVEPPTMKGGDEWLELDVGSSVTLNCDAKGTPKPTMTWVREDGKPIRINTSYSIPKHTGPTLTLHGVRPSVSGIYLCVASNGHPPTASRRIQIGVRFGPIVKGPGDVAEAAVGSRYTFRCLYAAFPHPDLHIMRTGPLGNHTLTQEFFRIRTVEDKHPYTHEMFLEMTRLEEADFGDYTCVVSNSEGAASTTTNLIQVTPPPTTPTPIPTKEDPMAPHLLIHRDNLTVPLLVESKPPLGGMGQAPNENPQESRKRPATIWPRKIGRVNLTKKVKNKSTPVFVENCCRWMVVVAVFSTNTHWRIYS